MLSMGFGERVDYWGDLEIFSGLLVFLGFGAAGAGLSEN